MDKQQNGNRNQQNEGKSTDKTSQDINLENTNPLNPKQNKTHRIGEGDEDLNQRKQETPKMGKDSSDQKENQDETELDDDQTEDPDEQTESNSKKTTSNQDSHKKK